MIICECSVNIHPCIYQMGSHFRCNCPVLKIRPEMSIYSISIHTGEEEGFNVPIQMLPQLDRAQ